MGLLPLDPSRVGQMCKVGCCLVVVRAVSRVLSLWLAGFTCQPQGHALERGRLYGGGARPWLFASQRRGRAGQISEQRLRAAHLFAL
ncbi:hypothetical protein MF628_001631 [Paenibacillus polymyxa]|uniref:hypothetical protein n=1 Tax=Paenibacillus polymyxa TaxID=1406 RepID=UPI002024136E|nr:hypothetical protein [Paenibacillus polymyxa]URJ47039.1 hypothetical protein MF628_001631 [Paenibacillus polymyxa]